MQIYLSKIKILALLMMIEEAKGMMDGAADGWYDLDKTNPAFYDKIGDAIHEMEGQLNSNGYGFEEDVRPLFKE